MTLFCSVSATPAVSSVVWNRTIKGLESSVTTDGVNYTGSTPMNPSLTIRRTDIYDEGTYLCTATNILGTDKSGDIVFSVTGKSIVLSWLLRFHNLAFLSGLICPLT